MIAAVVAIFSLISGIFALYDIQHGCWVMALMMFASCWFNLGVYLALTEMDDDRS